MPRILLHARDPRKWIKQSELNRDSFYKNYNNTGNLIWNYGISKALHHPQNEIVYNDLPLTRDAAERINSEFDHVVFSFANLINSRYLWRIQRFLEFIPHLKVPSTICSIGVQCESDEKADFIDPIKDDVKKLLRCFSDRPSSIGTRGAFTAQVLSDLGFSTAVTPIGCPSFYIQGSQYKAAEANGWNDTSTVFFNDNPKPKARRAFIECADRIFRDQYLYVTQDYIDPEKCSSEELLRLVAKEKLLIFTTFHSWRNALASGSLSVSSRIHGSVAAMHAGIPVLLVTLDRRTSELAEHIGLSKATLQEVSEAREPEDLLAKVDATHLQRTYETQYDVFRAFFRRNGLSHFEDPGEHDPDTYYEREILGKPKPEPIADCLVRFPDNHPVYKDTSTYIKKSARRAQRKAVLKQMISHFKF